MASMTEAAHLLALLFSDGMTAIGEGIDEGQSGAAAGFGRINGNLVYAFAQDAEVLSGGVGRAQAAKLKKVYELAAKTGAPVIGIYNSKGARLAEGSEVMTALGELIYNTNILSGVVPQISVVTGTCGGSLAMVACSADFVVMSKKAELFLTAPDILSTPAKGAGGIEAAVAGGLVSRTAEDAEEAIAEAINLLGYLPSNNLSEAPLSDFDEPQTGGDDVRGVINGMVDADSFTELSADFAKSVITGFATMEGISIGIVGAAGRLDSRAASKAARFVRICDSYNLPVISLLDTPGFDNSGEAELAGLVKDAAKLTHAYAEATCPKISVVCGQAIGPVFIAMAGRAAGADLTLALPKAEICPLPVEAAAIILHKDELATSDREQIIADYRAREASASAAASAGLVDSVVEAAELRTTLLSALSALSGKRVARLPKKQGNIQL